MDGALDEEIIRRVDRMEKLESLRFQGLCVTEKTAGGSRKRCTRPLLDWQ